MTHLLYLTVNMATVLVPLAASFHPKIRFSSELKYFMPANFITAAFFLAWDGWFTHHGVWSFNPVYTTGIYVLNLPLEEVLFFLCIPYSCMFTFHALHVLLKEKLPVLNAAKVTPVLAAALAGLAFLSGGRVYTMVTFLLLSFFLVVHQYVLKSAWLGRFYFVYALLLIPFLVVNGVLTGTGLDAPVVTYNDAENLGIRLLTIPIEDIFYGMLLVLLNVSLTAHFKSRSVHAVSLAKTG